MPESWQLLDQQAANHAAGEDDLALNEQLDDMNWEAEEMTFAQELTSMPTFQAVVDDEQRMSTYILRPQLISSVLKSELTAYLAERPPLRPDDRAVQFSPPAPRRTAPIFSASLATLSAPVADRTSATVCAV